MMVAKGHCQPVRRVHFPRRAIQHQSLRNRAEMTNDCSSTTSETRTLSVLSSCGLNSTQPCKAAFGATYSPFDKWSLAHKT
jgi:hypothetical protein